MPPASGIALVDDDASVRRAFDRLLGSAGYAVRTFASGDELLESGCGSDIACLVIDIHLIGMNGFELLETLRSRGVRSAAIFVTGNDGEPSRARAAAAGSAAYMVKPIEANALLEAVSAAIAASAARS